MNLHLTPAPICRKHMLGFSPFLLILYSLKPLGVQYTHHYHMLRVAHRYSTGQQGPTWTCTHETHTHMGMGPKPTIYICGFLQHCGLCGLQKTHMGILFLPLFFMHLSYFFCFILFFPLFFMHLPYFFVYCFVF